MITHFDDIGGAQVHVRDCASALLERGHEVRVLVGGRVRRVDELQDRGIPYTLIRSLTRAIHLDRDLKAIVEVRRALAEFKPDIISTHSSKAGLVGRLAARSLGMPTLFTAHGWAFTEGVSGKESFLYRKLEGLASRFAQRIITVSDYDRELALKHRVANPERLVPVHNGVRDVPKGLQAKPEREPVNIVMVARIAAQKDHKLLLRSLIPVSTCEWKLHVIGEGPLRSQVESLVDELHLSDRVVFWGGVRDVEEHLARAQLFVLASKWEGLPRSILEAMRAGLPVIASDVGGVREEIVDGETGFLIPPGDGVTFSARLEHLLVDPDLRRRMGQAGRKRYEAHFTFDRMFEQTLAVYNQVLGEQRSDTERGTTVKRP